MTKYLFIDGQCLQNSLTRMSEIYAGGQTINVNYNTLTRDYQRIFYYDALPERQKQEDEGAFKTRLEQQHQLFDRLSNLRGYHVYEGEMRRSYTRRGPEQKKIDVLIAVDMLTHSFRRNMQEAAILTGDLDFRPLIDALVLQGMFVTLWYPSKTNVEQLKASADQSMLFSIRQVHGAIDEDPNPFQYPATSQPPGENAPPVLARWTVGGREALLMKEDGGIYVAALPLHQHGNFLYYRFGDLNVLRAFVEDEHGVKIPNLG